MSNLKENAFPILKTKNLLLRAVEKGDAAEVFFLRSDPGVLTYLDKAPAQSLKEAIDWIETINESQKNGTAVTWAICLVNDRKLIGTICFWNIKLEHFRAEIGYSLHPQHQGNGYMSEAIQSVLDYGFQLMHLHSVEAQVNPKNENSIKLLERNGFRKEAYFKENYFYAGRFIDTAVYSLLNPI
jgi:ribosomal-protein-alanine N-acetyltransferase